MSTTLETTKSNIGPRSNYLLDRMFESKIEQIKLTGERIANRIADVNRKLDEDGAEASLNSLGELQSLGSEYDRLIAELCVIRKTANELVHAMLSDQALAAK